MDLFLCGGLVGGYVISLHLYMSMKRRKDMSKADKVSHQRRGSFYNTVKKNGGLPQ